MSTNTNNNELFDRIISIGSSHDNDVVLESKLISPHHARLIINNAEILLEDLKSNNGTFVNGQKITIKKINFSDKVQLSRIPLDIKDIVEQTAVPDSNKTKSNYKIMLIGISLISILSILYYTNVKTKIDVINQVKDIVYPIVQPSNNKQNIPKDNPSLAVAQPSVNTGKRAPVDQNNIKSAPKPIQQQVSKVENKSSVKYDESELPHITVEERNGFIQCGETLFGKIQAAGHSEKVNFNALAGEKIAIAVTKRSVSTLFNPCWKLLYQGNQIVKDIYNNRFSYDGNSSYILPYDGLYTILIFDDRNNGFGDYSIRLEPVGAYFNGELSAANEISCDGSTLYNKLKAPNGTDNYRFFSQAGEKIAIAVTKHDHSALFLPCWCLYDASGQVVRTIYNDKYSCEDNQSFILPETGPYTIKVYDKNFDGKGKYSISLEPVSPYFNGALSNATLISKGEKKYGKLETKKSCNSYMISLASGDKLNIYMSKKSASALFQPCWTLLNSSGNIIKTTYNDRVSYDKYASYIVPEDGYSTIRVCDKGLDGHGEYEISVQ